MKRFACSLLIALLIPAPAFAVNDSLTSGTVSLHHFANTLGFEVSLEQVENILTQKAQEDRILDSVTLINAAKELGLELQVQNLTYKHLQLLKCQLYYKGLFIVVEEATEKIFGTPQNAGYQATNKPLPASGDDENGHKYEETGYWHYYHLTEHVFTMCRYKMEFHGHSLSTTDENQKPLPTFRKAIMQVHRAVFNIPIAEEELGMTPDR